jgi:hypothetical protein
MPMVCMDIPYAWLLPNKSLELSPCMTLFYVIINALVKWLLIKPFHNEREKEDTTRLIRGP